jgi:hypothetical protein
VAAADGVVIRGLKLFGGWQMKKILSVIAVVYLILFILIEQLYDYRIRENLHDALWTPLNYIYPLLKWGFYVVTVVLCVLVLSDRSDNQPTEPRS